MEKAIVLMVILFLLNTKPIYTSDVEYNQVNNGVYSEVNIEIENKWLGFKSEFIPSQTEILSVQWYGNELVVDVSKEIISYGGGNAMEYAIVGELLEAAFSIPEVESFTLLIEGKEDCLPEGTRILGYTRERYNENNYFRNTK